MKERDVALVRRGGLSATRAKWVWLGKAAVTCPARTHSSCQHSLASSINADKQPVYYIVPRGSRCLSRACEQDNSSLPLSLLGWVHDASKRQSATRLSPALTGLHVEHARHTMHARLTCSFANWTSAPLCVHRSTMMRCSCTYVIHPRPQMSRHGDSAICGFEVHGTGVDIC